MKTRRIALSLLAAASLGACGILPRNKDTTFTSPKDGLIENSHRSIDAMFSRPLDLPGPVLVASLVDVNDIGDTSTLGRVLSEQMATRLTQRGVDVVEARLNEKTYTVTAKGTYMLSAKLSEIARYHHAGAVLLGTYGIVQGQAYVSARLVSVETGIILASDDFVVPVTEASGRPDTIVIDRYGDGATITSAETKPSAPARRRIAK